jgi:hypothetical protein
MSLPAPVFTLALPEYTVDVEPDYGAVGPKLDRFIIAGLSGRLEPIR